MFCLELLNQPMLKLKDSNYFEVETQKWDQMEGYLTSLVDDDYSTIRHAIDCNIEYNLEDPEYIERVANYKKAIAQTIEEEYQQTKAR